MIFRNRKENLTLMLKSFVVFVFVISEGHKICEDTRLL